jgi:hypothetical protein
MNIIRRSIHNFKNVWLVGRRTGRAAEVWRMGALFSHTKIIAMIKFQIPAQGGVRCFHCAAFSMGAKLGTRTGGGLTQNRSSLCSTSHHVSPSVQYSHIKMHVCADTCVSADFNRKIWNNKKFCEELKYQLSFKFRVDVFWAVMSYCVVEGYQHLGGPGWRWRQHGHLKRWYPTTHGITTQNTSTWNITTLQASKLVSFQFFS